VPRDDYSTYTETATLVTLSKVQVQFDARDVVLRAFDLDLAVRPVLWHVIPPRRVFDTDTMARSDRRRNVNPQESRRTKST